MIVGICSSFKGYRNFSRNDKCMKRTLGLGKFQRTTALYSVQCFVIHPVHNQPFVGSIEKYHLVHIIIIHARSPTNTLTHTHYYNIILLIISRSSVLLYIIYINKAAAIAEHNTLIFVYFVGFALKKKNETKPHSNLSPSLSSSLATFTAFAADDVQVRIYKYTTVESLMRLERK